MADNRYTDLYKPQIAILGLIFVYLFDRSPQIITTSAIAILGLIFVYLCHSLVRRR